MNRPGTALGVLLCTLAASVLAMGSARGAGKFAAVVAAVPESATTREVAQVAYIVVLPAGAEHSSGAYYECGQEKTQHALQIATELPALTRIGENNDLPIYNYTAINDALAGTLGAELRQALGDNERAIEQLFPSAPAVVFDLDDSDEFEYSGKVIDWEAAVYEKYLAESLDENKTYIYRATQDLLAATVEENVGALANLATRQTAVADRWLAQRGVSACYPTLWAGVQQLQLEREIAELFGDTTKPVVAELKPVSAAAVSDSVPVDMKIEKQAIHGAARALDQLGASLQGISQRLERLSQSQSETGRWTFPETAPRSSRVIFSETSR